MASRSLRPTAFSPTISNCRSSDDSRADQRFAQTRASRWSGALEPPATAIDRCGGRFPRPARRGLFAGRGNRRSRSSRCSQWDCSRSLVRDASPRSSERCAREVAGSLGSHSRRARKTKPVDHAGIYGHAIRRMRPHLGRLASRSPACCLPPRRKCSSRGRSRFSSTTCWAARRS